MAQCLEEVHDTEIDLNGTLVKALDYDQTERGLFVHVGTWADRERASIVLRRDKGERQIGEARPGRNWDFLAGDGMFLLAGNDCLIMPSRMPASLMQTYLRGLFWKGGSRFDAPTGFTLTAVADRDVAKTLRREGVQRIDLGLQQYMATAQEDASPPTPLARFGGQLLDLLTTDASRQRLEEEADMKARLVIEVGKGKGRKARQAALASIAEEMSSEPPSDEVVYVTGTGRRVRHGTLPIKKKVWLPPYGASVPCEEAWHALDQFLDELEATGAREE